MTFLCPCHSGKLYNQCCQPYHLKKQNPQTALELMRSRYSAFSLNKASYLMETTHNLNPQFKNNKVKWKIELQEFSQTTLFEGLEILDYQENEKEAFVSFLATLSSHGQKIFHKEKSYFIKENNKWLYRSFEWI